jgi:isoquinoline 1-oxidoreductase beta subunit
VKASYTLPYLPHATMEPMNCLVRLSADKCEIWTGAQSQSSDQGYVAKLLKLKPEQVEITMLVAGGSFGRRANPAGDYVLEAVEIAQKVGVGVPVKLVWTREDDMLAGWYREAGVHHLTAALDAKGMLTAWHARTVSQSLFIGTPFEAGLVKNGIDMGTFEGAMELPYTVANHQLEGHFPKLPVPVQWWRSVGNTHTGFIDECFIDECAHAAGQDPVAYRLALLTDSPRHAGVLKLAAEKSGWGTKPAAGRARGVAVHKSFGSYVAHVVEVSMDAGKVRVHKVTSAVDCGTVINPDVVRAQVEGAVGFGLSAALYGKITFDHGKAVESNFDRYRPLRLPEMPVVEVHLVPSTEHPTGIGEPGLPPLAPAIANAIFALTGTRVRELPFISA